MTHPDYAEFGDRTRRRAAAPTPLRDQMHDSREIARFAARTGRRVAAELHTIVKSAGAYPFALVLRCERVDAALGQVSGELTLDGQPGFPGDRMDVFLDADGALTIRTIPSGNVRSRLFVFTHEEQAISRWTMKCETDDYAFRLAFLYYDS
jgi:hypothetical protein